MPLVRQSRCLKPFAQDAWTCRVRYVFATEILAMISFCLPLFQTAAGLTPHWRHEVKPQVLSISPHLFGKLQSG
jgi:hypothetical protein